MERFTKLSQSPKFVLTNGAEYGTLAPLELTAPKTLTMEACKHPRVRVLMREEDAEFVECLECGEVFDSLEFSDMAIEEKTKHEDDE